MYKSLVVIRCNNPVEMPGDPFQQGDQRERSRSARGAGVRSAQPREHDHGVSYLHKRREGMVVEVLGRDGEMDLEGSVGFVEAALPGLVKGYGGGRVYGGA